MILLTEIPLARNYYLVSVPDIRESHITRRLAESCSVLSLQEEFDISKGTNTLSIFGGVARGFSTNFISTEIIQMEPSWLRH